MQHPSIKVAKIARVFSILYTKMKETGNTRRPFEYSIPVLTEPVPGHSTILDSKHKVGGEKGGPKGGKNLSARS